MQKNKCKLAIVNRSFWPQNQVLGEALLRFAEQATSKMPVCVITQAKDDVKLTMEQTGRGKGVEMRVCPAYTDSSSGILKRAFEAVGFMFWTFISLVRARPSHVYVSTDPPVIVPFIVAVYCALTSAKFFYHLQDIHPEATHIVVPLNKQILSVLKWIDNFSLRHAEGLITLSKEMQDSLVKRSSTSCRIYLLDNPSLQADVPVVNTRIGDLVFCGNAGRLQRIPLVLSAIRCYIERGGNLKFSFAGGGVYSPTISNLANEFAQVSYHGLLPAAEASQLVRSHRWALLPIDDEVTKYAFPSKSSSYIMAECGILAVCGLETSVARWVLEHKVGIVCEPDRDALVRCFFELEQMQISDLKANDDLLDKLNIDFFVRKLTEIVIGGE